mmetsp:Transcript_7457/g.16434  ORF Transcript_7457/g.16434 Transcript_7457/m.16434 type:complete len:229 (+) Transcript_7457:275-961(+)
MCRWQASGRRLRHRSQQRRTKLARKRPHSLQSANGIGIAPSSRTAAALAMFTLVTVLMTMMNGLSSARLPSTRLAPHKLQPCVRSALSSNTQRGCSLVSNCRRPRLCAVSRVRMGRLCLLRKWTCRPRCRAAFWESLMRAASTARATASKGPRRPAAPRRPPTQRAASAAERRRGGGCTASVRQSRMDTRSGHARLRQARQLPLASDSSFRSPGRQRVVQREGWGGCV